MSAIGIYSSTEAREGILRRIPWKTRKCPTGAGWDRTGFWRTRFAGRAVRRILRDVRGRGDAALLEWSARIDGISTPALEVAPVAWRAAYESLATTSVQRSIWLPRGSRAFIASNRLARGRL